MSNENNENKFQGDELPGLDEKPLVNDFSHIQIHTFPDKLHFDIKGETYEGYVTYTEGLEDVLSFELLAFSNEKPTEEDEFGLRGTASMLNLEVPHLIPVAVSQPVLDYLRYKGIPTNARVQVLCDQYALDHDGPTTPETAEWVPDGGTALFNQTVLTHAADQFFDALDRQKDKQAAELMAIQRGHIEKVGFTQVGVFDPEGKAPVFIYTVGLSNMELPELFISGYFDPQAMSHIVGQAVTRFQELGKFEELEFERAITVEIEGVEHDISIRSVLLENPKVLHDNYMLRADAILERPVTSVAVLQFSDIEKRYPGDLDFDNIFSQVKESLVGSALINTFLKATPKSAEEANKIVYDHFSQGRATNYVVTLHRTNHSSDESPSWTETVVAFDIEGAEKLAEELASKAGPDVMVTSVTLGAP